MRKYWFYGILAMVCLVLLAGLSIRARAEMAGVTVTAVLEKDAPGSSPGPSGGDPDEEPDDDSDDNPDGEPDDDSGGNPDGVPDDDSGNNPKDEPNDEQDDNQDDVPSEDSDDTLDDASSEDPDDNSEENSDDTTDVSEDGEDDGKADQYPGSELEEADGELKPEENESSYGKRIWMIPVVIVLIVAGILGGVTGLWAYLWLLLTWYLLKTWRKKWHGILTDEENRFIEIRPTADDYRLAQDIIDYCLNPAEALHMLEETGDLTYLPGSCKVWISYWLDGAYRTEKVSCNESRVYELMAGLGDVGEKQVVIENRMAGIRILLQYP